MIREATEVDIPRIVELGSRSLLDGPYKDTIADNPERAARLALGVIQTKGKILLAEEDDTVIGLLGFFITTPHFSDELVAAELMWYVLPERRNTGAAIKLLWAAEVLAKAMGATSMVFTAPNDTVAALYKRFGYTAIEVNFRKVL